MHSCTLVKEWVFSDGAQGCRSQGLRVAQGCGARTHTGTDTDTGADACLGEILPAPSCVVFTMVVDIVDMLGFVLRHECIVDQ